MPRREPIPADDADGAGRIQTVTDNLVDAARDDGAGAWQTALAVILPYIRGTLMVAGLFRLIDSIKAFPDRRSNRLILHILVVVLAVLVLGPFLWLLRVSFAKSTAASGHEEETPSSGPSVGSRLSKPTPAGRSATSQMRRKRSCPATSSAGRTRHCRPCLQIKGSPHAEPALPIVRPGSQSGCVP